MGFLPKCFGLVIALFTVAFVSCPLLAQDDNPFSERFGSEHILDNDPFEAVQSNSPNTFEAEVETSADRLPGDMTLLADPPWNNATAPATSTCHCAGDSDTESVRRIYQKLNGPLRSTGLEFHEAELGDVVQFLTEEYEIPILMDMPALDDLGIDAEEPISASIRNVTLKSALRLLLKQVDLTFVVSDEVLLITSQDEAATRLKICVYRVGDVVPRTNGKVDFDALIDVIISCVATDTWAENGGGEAEIRALPADMLVISQSQAVHEEIKSLLAAIRHSRRSAAPRPQNVSANQNRVGDDVELRSYLLTFADGVAAQEEAERTALFLHQVLRNEAANQGQATESFLLDSIGDRIVVRGTTELHERVKSALRDLGLIPSSEAGGGFGSGGRRGGFGGGGVFRTRD